MLSSVDNKTPPGGAVLCRFFHRDQTRQRMPIADHRATGQGVFGIKRHVKSGLQKGVRTADRCGLGLPARRRVFFDLGKTADYAAAEPENCADGNHAFGGKGWPQHKHRPSALRRARSALMRSAPVCALPVVGRPGGRLSQFGVKSADLDLSLAIRNPLSAA